MISHSSVACISPESQSPSAIGVGLATSRTSISYRSISSRDRRPL